MFLAALSACYRLAQRAWSFPCADIRHREQGPDPCKYTKCIFRRVWPRARWAARQPVWDSRNAGSASVRSKHSNGHSKGKLPSCSKPSHAALSLLRNHKALRCAGLFPCQGRPASCVRPNHKDQTGSPNGLFVLRLPDLPSGPARSDDLVTPQALYESTYPTI